MLPTIAILPSPRPAALKPAFIKVLSELRNVLSCVATTSALVDPALIVKAPEAPETVIVSLAVNVPPKLCSLFDKPVVAVIPIPLVSKSLFFTVYENLITDELSEETFQLNELYHQFEAQQMDRQKLLKFVRHKPKKI